MTTYRTTTYGSRGTEHEAVQISWEMVEEILGEPHAGEPEQDARLVAALVAAGAPSWVGSADGWVDELGWGLIGPEVVREDAGDE